MGAGWCFHHLKSQHLRVGPSRIPGAGKGLFAYGPNAPGGIVFHAGQHIVPYDGEVLSLADDTAAIDYIVRFLAGVARSAHDRMLEDAATTLARDHSEGKALATDLARISGLVQDRLASVQAS